MIIKWRSLPLLGFGTPMRSSFTLPHPVGISTHLLSRTTSLSRVAQQVGRISVLGLLTIHPFHVYTKIQPASQRRPSYPVLACPRTSVNGISKTNWIRGAGFDSGQAGVVQFIFDTFFFFLAVAFCQGKVRVLIEIRL
jgi:hypothetical protein